VSDLHEIENNSVHGMNSNELCFFLQNPGKLSPVDSSK